MEETFKVYPHLQSLDKLSSKYRTVFAASCCERLIPNYVAFSIMDNWGPPDVLENALEFVWVSLQVPRLDAQHVRALIQACQKIIPDTEDFTSLFSGAALNAAAAVCYTLMCLEDGKLEHAVYAGRLAIETIESYLHTVNKPSLAVSFHDPTFSEWLDQAPLFISEMDLQRKTIQSLQSYPALDKAFLDAIRRSSSVTGIQPFLRGLVK